MCDSHNHDHNDVKRTHDHPAVDHPDVDTPKAGEKDLSHYVREILTHHYDFRDTWEELRDPDKRVIRGSDIPFTANHPHGEVEGSQVWSKANVLVGNNITQSLIMFQHVLAPEAESHKHYHQNEAYMYILEGKGYEIHDGKEYTWEGGDLVLIHGGCVHQHFSEDPNNPCRALIVNPKPLYIFSHLLYQGDVEGPPTEPAKYDDWVPPYSYYDKNGEVVNNE